MSQLNFIARLLEIKDSNINFFKVEDLRTVRSGVIYHFKAIYARLSYQLSHCLHCGFASLIKNGTTLTKLRLPTLNGPMILLYLRKQRYFCKSCQTTCGANTPIVEKNHSLTRGLKSAVVKLAKQSLPVTTIAKLVGISPSSVTRILYHDFQRPQRLAKLPEHLCFDEFKSVARSYSFIAIDAKKHNLISILDDRLSKNICAYFENRYSLEERSAVKSVVIDLNANYQLFIRRLFPHAKIIIDRFHIVQLVNRAFDQLRVTILKQQSDKHSRIYKALKINWRLFHKDTEKINRSKTQYFRGHNEYMTQQNLIDLGLSTNSKLKYTYETAHQIQEAIKKQDSKKLRQVLTNYQKQQSPMDTSITILKKNLKYVSNSCESTLSNGPIEGINRKIKALKRICYGFKNMDHFYARTLLIVK
ncbi:ISL3 family transposase [Liquorilactobacillus nagelii]|uniref:ISL3 family transposase n=1 Tax=Liquorilactobacillus nagelii TaxID=82688 RepID=UPI0039E75E9D